ncbi:immune-responsive protein [Aspergillus aurantiobrunneus]
MDPNQNPSATKQLSEWIHGLALADIAPEQVTRCKFLLLDGLACALIGAQLPWSQTAVHGVSGIESPGNCSIIGWEKKLGPLPAALLNSTFIQAFELDDYHREAPIHSNSIVIPTLLAALQHHHNPSTPPTSGPSFLLAAITGYETGPRVGLGVYGGDVLSQGWHSGAIFGPAAAAAAASKLLQLPSSAIEDAIGIACTQAGGLMAAQYESSVKRMQHGFAARNGLFAALMAHAGYSGIKDVLDRPYGGFLSTFSHGNGREPAYVPDRVVRELGAQWEIDQILVKPYASMAATHGTIDCVIAVQEKYGRDVDVERIRRVVVEMSDPAWKKGGWKVTRPLTATGAQMSCAYAAAMQLLEGQVQPAQFAAAQLEREDVWRVMEKIECVHNKDFDVSVAAAWQQRIHVELDGDEGERKVLTELVAAPRGNLVPLSNEEILAKWRKTTRGVADPERLEAIERIVLGIEQLDDVSELAQLLFGQTENVLRETS